MYYNFVMTCCACPEQYDVLDADGVPIAYVRYRHGEITVNPYKVTYIQENDSYDIDFENVIYVEKIGGTSNGQFLDSDRDKILEDIDKKIYDYFKDT